MPVPLVIAAGVAAAGGAGAAAGGKSQASRKPSCNSSIDSIEKLLKNTCCSKRNCKQQYLLHKGPRKHIYIVFSLFVLFHIFPAKNPSPYEEGKMLFQAVLKNCKSSVYLFI